MNTTVNTTPCITTPPCLPRTEEKHTCSWTGSRWQSDCQLKSLRGGRPSVAAIGQTSTIERRRSKVKGRKSMGDKRKAIKRWAGLPRVGLMQLNAPPPPPTPTPGCAVHLFRLSSTFSQLILLSVFVSLVHNDDNILISINKYKYKIRYN